MNWRRLGIRIAITVAVVLAILTGLWQLSRAKTFQVFGELYPRVETSEKVVALTFDDGPTPANTPAVLEVLARHDVKATFFMVGRNIAAHRDLAARVLAAGHQLANHSYSHVRLILHSPSFIRSEIDRTDALLREVGVKGEILFRAPYGKKLFVLPWLLSRAHRKHILFDVVPHDHEIQDSALITSRVVEAARPGSIILLHDGGKPKPGTIEATDRIITSLQARGYRFVTVSELLALEHR